MVITAMAVFFVFLVSHFVFENIPHLEDEIAYQWQARTFAEGAFYVPSPANTEANFVPFIIDQDGRRFSKYPPGWSILLAIGMVLGIEHWVPAILAGLNTWLTYRISQRILGERPAILTAILLCTSPFFLFVSGSLLSHPWSLFLTLSLTLAWLDLFTLSSPLTSLRFETTKAVTAGLAIGVLFITRPFTALGVVLPFLVHVVSLFISALKSSDGTRHLKKILFIIGGCGLLAGCILFLWQFAVTGNPLQNLYELWWDYDKVGFGPGHGPSPEGYTFLKAFKNLFVSLRILNIDLFGWRIVSLIFIPFGLWSLRKNPKALLVCSIPFSLMFVHMAYWFAPISFFGPRYYFEGIFGLCILTSAGVYWLASLFPHVKVSRWLTWATLSGLILYNLFVYIPLRIKGMTNLYDISQADLQPFLEPSADITTPALIIVEAQKNTDYFGLLTLEDPWLTTPFIFVYNKPGVEIDPAAYPGRVIYDYFPETQEFIRVDPDK